MPERSECHGGRGTPSGTGVFWNLGDERSGGPHQTPTLGGGVGLRRSIIEGIKSKENKAWVRRSRRGHSTQVTFPSFSGQVHFKAERRLFFPI